MLWGIATVWMLGAVGLAGVGAAVSRSTRRVLRRPLRVSTTPTAAERRAVAIHGVLGAATTAWFVVGVPLLVSISWRAGALVGQALYGVHPYLMSVACAAMFAILAPSLVVVIIAAPGGTGDGTEIAMPSLVEHARAHGVDPAAIRVLRVAGARAGVSREGGRVVVRLGSDLIDALSPAGLRAVLCHELAHVDHGFAPLRRTARRLGAATSWIPWWLAVAPAGWFAVAWRCAQAATDRVGWQIGESLADRVAAVHCGCAVVVDALTATHPAPDPPARAELDRRIAYVEALRR